MKYFIVKQCQRVIASCGTVPNSDSECWTVPDSVASAGQCQTVVASVGQCGTVIVTGGTVLDSASEHGMYSMAL